MPFCFSTLCGRGHLTVFLKEMGQHIRDLCWHVIAISYLCVVTDLLASGWYVWVLEVRRLIVPGRNDDIPWVRLLWVEQILTHHVTCWVKEKKRNIWHRWLWLQSQLFNFTSLSIKQPSFKGPFDDNLFNDIISRPPTKSPEIRKCSFWGSNQSHGWSGHSEPSTYYFFKHCGCGFFLSRGTCVQLEV